MSSRLEIAYACSSEAGVKPRNADAADARVPPDDLLLSKGVAAAIADGMSSSEGGHEASQVCVTGFLNDYYSTPESWRVKSAASRIMSTLNTWLCGQGQNRYDSPRGMVTTFSAAVIKSTTAHLLHVGDSRIYLCRGSRLEPMTRDHRVWVSAEREMLTRAMGIDSHLEIDYRAVALEEGDRLLFTTDGVHDFLTDRQLQEILQQYRDNLQQAVREVTGQALRAGSDDNVTCQLLQVISLPGGAVDDIYHRVLELPFPPHLKPGMNIDGYGIQRELHASKRSEVFLVVDGSNGEQLTLKTPSINFKDDAEFLSRFLNEEWVGRRINNPHVMKIHSPRQRRFLYHIAEYIEGQTLRQLIDDRGRLELPLVRDYLAQAITGLRAFHRMEMVHQDLKPDNLMIDHGGLLKIIDFGSARIAGIEEIRSEIDHDLPQGTLNYTAPEVLAGEKGSKKADIFSLGVIAYEMLTGQLPYAEHERPLPARRMRYRPARQHAPDLPPWVDAALKKATDPSPLKRYDTLSEFLQDMKRPNRRLIPQHKPPLLQRHPVRVWVALAGLLLISNLVTLFLLLLQRQ
ncbi:MAG: protein kinase [Sedimenticola sp.]|nr:protein kinase [Sedimenticola sp.]